MSLLNRSKSLATTIAAALVGSLLVLNPVANVPAASAVLADGSDSEVDYAASISTTAFIAGTNQQVIPNDQTFTVETWLRSIPSVGGYHTIMSQNQNRDSSPNRFWLGMWVEGENQNLHIGCGATYVNVWLQEELDDGSWKHLAVAMSKISTTETKYEVFIGGNKIDEGSMANCQSIAANVSPFTIGSLHTSGTGPDLNFEGQIDQVKIWDETLTAQEIKLSMHSLGKPSGVNKTLRAHYDFNEPSGATVIDRSVNTFNLTANSSFTRTDVKQETQTADGSTLLTFPRTYLPGIGGWRVPSAVDAPIQALIVGGGGAGGSSYDNVGAGGGGAGQVIETSQVLPPNSVVTVQVGSGGTAAQGDPTYMIGSGFSGQSSILGATEAIGGGGGGGRASSGLQGASGGGSGGRNASDLGGTGLAGNDGGKTTENFGAGAGGGGAGTAGANSDTSAAGQGGDGVLSTILNEVVAQGGNGGVKTDLDRVTSSAGVPGTGSGGDGAHGENANGGTSIVTTPGTFDLPEGAIGGSGGSGIVVLLIPSNDFRSLEIVQPAVAPNATVTLSGTVSAAAGTFILSLNSNTGSFTVASADVASAGVAANTGLTAANPIAFSGSATALNVILNKIVFNAPATESSAIISGQLTPVVPLSYSSVIQDPATGHLYTTDTTTRNFSASLDFAANQSFAGIEGYLATPNSAAETSFLTASAVAANNLGLSTFNFSTLYIGLSDAGSDGYFSSTWSWKAGPLSGSPVSIGHVGEAVAYSAIAGAYHNWPATEPNGNSNEASDPRPANCAVTNFTVNTYGYGTWDDEQCSSTRRPLIEYGGQAGDLGFASVAFIVEQPTVDIEFTELNFDYGNSVNVTSGGRCANNSNDCVGKNQSDIVRFKNVSTRNGVSVDAVVLTKTLPSGGRVDRYEVGTGAGGESSFFETDVTLTRGGAAVFEFSFYLADTYDTPNETQVRLKNVNVSLIDIDYYQYNDLTDIDSYTVTTNTYLKSCVAATAITSCGSTTANPNFSKPNFARFQGRSGYATNNVRDMAIASYGAIETFEIAVGTTRGSNNSNLYGVAFKALPWGSQTPSTTGASYTLTYNLNGGSGTTPANQSANLAAEITLASTGNIQRTGFSFVGWNTEANGSGTSYAAGSKFSMPQGGDVLYAQWTPIQYQLSYDANGGGGAPASENLSGGTQTNLSATTPQRSGFTFLHWATSADGTGSTYSAFASFTMPSSNTVLYAQWQAQTGVLYYVANGGTSTESSVSITAASRVTVASGANTQRTGYTFVGWNAAANGSGVDYNPGSSFTVAQGNNYLYAQWSAVQYTLTYLANGGSGAPSAQSHPFQDEVNISGTTPSRAGYDFVDWNTAANGSGSGYSSSATFSMPANNVSVYAQWTPKSYSLSYNVNGGSGTIATQSEQAFSTATITGTEPNLSGFKFVGWNTADDGSGTSYATGSSLVMPANDVVLYAQWVSEIYDVIYLPNGGVGGQTPSSSSGQSQISISSTLPDRLGYTFGSWNSLANGNGTDYNPGENFTVLADVTFFAKWIAQLFNLSYDVNGGETVAPTTQSGLIVSQSATVDSTVPSRSGYVFVGWATTLSAGAATYLGGNSIQMPAADVVLYAKWSGLRYNLRYNSNGGTGAPANETPQTGESVLVGTNPLRDGYTFAGWNTELDGSGTTYSVNGLLTMPPSDVTLFAQWTPIIRQVTFEDNGGGSGPADLSQTFSSTVTIPQTIPTRPGFNFTGWNTNCNGSGTSYQAGDQFPMPANNISLCAQWSAITYILSYDANGGSNAPASAALASGTAVSASSALPSRLGYSFASWNSAIDGSGTRYLAGANLTMPAQNTTLYAIWVANPYAVYFSANGGSGAPSPQSARTAESVTLTAIQPTRPGYTFVDWNVGINGDDVGYSSSATLTMPPNNLTLYAQWAFIPYQLTYDANGGTAEPAAQSNLTVSQQVELSGSEPNRAGYIFNGWNTQANGSGAGYATGSNLIMPASDVTLYAEWVADTFNVIYNANGGGGAPDPDAYSTGATVTVQSAPTTPKNGHTFTHWATATDGSGDTFSPTATTTMPAGGIRLFAQWTSSNVSIAYDINGGTGATPSTITASFSDEVSLNPGTGFSKSGQAFLGWNTLANGQGVAYAPEQVIAAEDLTLYAQWSAVFYALDYNPAGGTNAPSSVVTTAGQSVAVSQVTPQLTGFVFEEWENVTGDQSFTPGSLLTMPASNVVLFATWAQPQVIQPGSSGGPPPQVPTVSPSLSPTVSQTVSETISDSVSAPVETAPDPVTPEQERPVATKPEIDWRVKEEQYDPDTFDNWSSSEAVSSDEEDEPAPASTAEADQAEPVEQAVAADNSDNSGDLPLWLGLGAIPVLGSLALWVARRRRS